MELNSFKKINKTIKQQGVVTISIVAILAIAFTVCMINLSNKLDTLYDKAIVIDTKGNIYEGSGISSKDMRIYEYENHIKTFVHLWYSFDENNYESNIKNGLELIGDEGKKLLDEYNNAGIYSLLRQRNLHYTLSIKDIKIDMSTIPVSGILTATQIGSRAKGRISRDMQISFTIYDISRSGENPHGCKIGEWQVKFSKAYNPDGENLNEENNEESK